MMPLLAGILAATVVGGVVYFVYQQTVVREEKRLIHELEQRDDTREREQAKDYEQWLD